MQQNERPWGKYLKARGGIKKLGKLGGVVVIPEDFWRWLQTEAGVEATSEAVEDMQQAADEEINKTINVLTLAREWSFARKVAEMYQDDRELRKKTSEHLLKAENALQGALEQLYPIDAQELKDESLKIITPDMVRR